MMTPRGVSDVNVYTPERVELRYGVRPDQVPDFIGLKGDTSDNIPGIPGIGDKTAGQLDRAVRFTGGAVIGTRMSWARQGPGRSVSAVQQARRRSVCVWKTAPSQQCSNPLDHQSSKYWCWLTSLGSEMLSARVRRV